MGLLFSLELTHALSLSERLRGAGRPPLPASALWFATWANTQRELLRSPQASPSRYDPAALDRYSKGAESGGLSEPKP